MLLGDEEEAREEEVGVEDEEEAREEEASVADEEAREEEAGVEDEEESREEEAGVEDEKEAREEEAGVEDEEEAREEEARVADEKGGDQGERGWSEDEKEARKEEAGVEMRRKPGRKRPEWLMRREETRDEEAGVGDEEEAREEVIYVASNIKDVAVSYYHLHRMVAALPTPDSWGDFLDHFIQGTVCFGSWSSHVKGWWKMRQQRDILYLFYEDMQEDPRREIKKVMTFLGKDLSDEVLEKIHQNSSFQAMKNNPMSNYSTFPYMDHSIFPFMRKGICGAWKNHFTVSQRERFDEYYQREMSGTDLSFCFWD
ncbi:sulfotransferase 1C2A-like [Mixophyes fleayi]|uniref:sulfotransferase 1C2A-like n=1 Tax=Mixophyes fleayi TaxID=3061075 RepID=UPI003F4E2751